MGTSSLDLFSSNIKLNNVILRGNYNILIDVKLPLNFAILQSLLVQNNMYLALRILVGNLQTFVFTHGIDIKPICYKDYVSVITH